MFAVQSQVLLHAKRNLDGQVGIVRGSVRNRCNRNLSQFPFFGFVSLERQDDCAGTVFASFHAPLCSLFSPEVRVGNDQADLRLGEADHG